MPKFIEFHLPKGSCYIQIRLNHIKNTIFNLNSANMNVKLFLYVNGGPEKDLRSMFSLGAE